MVLSVIVGIANIRSTGALKDGARGVVVGVVAGVVTAFAGGMNLGLGIIVSVVVSFSAGISASSRRRAALSLICGIVAGIILVFIVNKAFTPVPTAILNESGFVNAVGSSILGFLITLLTFSLTL